MQWACFNSAWFSPVTKINPIKGNWVLLSRWLSSLPSACVEKSCPLVPLYFSPPSVFPHPKNLPVCRHPLLPLLDDMDRGHLTHCSSRGLASDCQSGALCFPGEQTELAKSWSHERALNDSRTSGLPEDWKDRASPWPTLQPRWGAGTLSCRRWSTTEDIKSKKGCNRLMFYILRLLPWGWIWEEFGSWDGTSSSSLVLRCPTVAIIMPMGSRKSPASSFPCILGSF